MTKKKKPKKIYPTTHIAISTDNGKTWQNMVCVPSGSFTDRLNLEKK